MKFISEMAIEGKVGIAAGLLAFILSLLTGLFSGIKFYHVFIRSVLMGPLLGAIGFSMILVLKKFVPEIYDALSSSLSRIETGLKSSDMPDLKIKDDEMAEMQEKAVFTESHEPIRNKSEEAQDQQDISQKMPSDESFTEFTPNDFSKVSLADDNARGESAAAMEPGKLGKHLFSKENIVKYEPKVMAQAIRSMISKDE